MTHRKKPPTQKISRRVAGSGGRKSKSGFANPVFNTAFCQIVFGLYLGLHDQIVFGFGLYLPDLLVVDLECIYVRYYFEYLDLDFIYELSQYLDLQIVDLCPATRRRARQHSGVFIIDREAREIIYLVASVRLSVRRSAKSREESLSVQGVCLCVE